MKIAAYIEDVDEDPIAAINYLSKKDIKNIAIKNIYRQNIRHINDDVCKNIKIVCNKTDTNILLLSSDIGYTEELRVPEIERLFIIAEYFKAKFIRFGLLYNRDAILNIVNDFSLKHGITPVFETSRSIRAAEMNDIVQKNKKWRIVYDPAQIILKTNIDPYKAYYTIIRDNIVIIDIHDYKIGFGHKPAGFGDGKLSETFSDRSYQGWYILEPNLGVKYGSALNRQETFDLALESAQNLFDSLQT